MAIHGHMPAFLSGTARKPALKVDRSQSFRIIVRWSRGCLLLPFRRYPTFRSVGGISTSAIYLVTGCNPSSYRSTVFNQIRSDPIKNSIVVKVLSTTSQLDHKRVINARLKSPVVGLELGRVADGSVVVVVHSVVACY